MNFGGMLGVIDYRAAGRERLTDVALKFCVARTLDGKQSYSVSPLEGY